MKTPHADLTKLYPYCDYEMQVCSYNAMGDGFDTDVVTCQTLEDGNHRSAGDTSTTTNTIIL